MDIIIQQLRPYEYFEGIMEDIKDQSIRDTLKMFIFDLMNKDIENYRTLRGIPIEFYDTFLYFLEVIGGCNLNVSHKQQSKNEK